ncbi:hypothetical protein LA303_11115 [Candidatus Sulfidibacterium hydrothermale]|uniref:hypothetical protein n=1 Tax=Candidatus Sulfidibacterium hydrothermale TaxID=2875962 RepID=UPI001F0A55E7|nr:hypothetical protein [Candidatus Sulfidibacterium hydrothermale]UBM61948.1 hypothetical protein LA303_11115 [Candidatus Sulfidibacterium hydrothermale]
MTKLEIPKNKKSNHKKISNSKNQLVCPSERSEESILTAMIIFRSFTALRSVQDDIKTLLNR